MGSRKTKSRKARPKKSFDEAAFVRSLWKTMQAQEKSHPAVALVRHRLEAPLFLLGLTGGIASGKSLVSGFLRNAGLPVIDADQLARDVVLPGRTAYKKILRTFGRDLLQEDGGIDRSRLASLVFSDAEKRKLLESITHPEIFREISKRVASLRKEGHRFLVIDAALLFESGLSDYVDKVLLVRAEPQEQLRRLMERDGIDETEALRRIAAQMSDAKKREKADFIIDNSGSIEDTQRQTLEVLRQISSI